MVSFVSKNLKLIPFNNISNLLLERKVFDNFYYCDLIMAHVFKLNTKLNIVRNHISEY